MLGFAKFFVIPFSYGVYLDTSNFFSVFTFLTRAVLIVNVTWVACEGIGVSV